MISRFYFLKQSVGSATIYRALSDEPMPGASGTTVYAIRYDQAADSLVVDASGPSGGSTGFIDVSGFNGWISIEVDWQSGGLVSVWVGSDATSEVATATASAGTGTISAARLGTMDVTGGSPDFAFDDYEARNATAIGLLTAGDATDDGIITLADSLIIRQEILGISLASGVPDCTLNGLVTVADSVCSLRILLGLRKGPFIKGGLPDLIFLDSFESP